MKTIVTCAITGGVTRPQDTPYLPVKPEEIVRSGLEAAAAGASILHIHVRNPATGQPSVDVELYRYVVEEVRKQNSDVLINLTTGPGASYLPTPGNLRVGGLGTALFEAEKRVEHIELLRPDLCSLDFNTMHLDSGVIRINYLPVVKEMARRILASGTKPELELFDSGDVRIARELFDEGFLGPDPFWQLAMGIKYGWDHTPLALGYAHQLLPAGCAWSAFGIGRMSLPLAAMAWTLGGHVRVGMEDNIFLSKGVLAKSNAELISKAVSVLCMLGAEIATPAEARAILKLERRT